MIFNLNCIVNKFYDTSWFCNYKNKNTKVSKQIYQAYPKPQNIFFFNICGSYFSEKTYAGHI